MAQTTLEALCSNAGQWEKEWKPGYEALGKRQRADLFRHLNSFTDRVFAHHPMFADARNLLGEKQEGKVILAVNQCDFSGTDTYRDEASYRQLLSAARAKEQLKREIILDFLNNTNDLGLKPHERLVVAGFCRMANVIDDIAMKWREDVIWSDLGRKIHALNDPEKNGLTVSLRKLGLAHPYAVLVPDESATQADFDKLTQGEDEHGYKEVSYAERYQEEHAKLQKELRHMIGQLLAFNRQTGDEVDKYIHYLTSWNNLAESTDVTQCNYLSEELDAYWRQLTGDVLLTHPMEYGYYDPLGLRKDFAATLDVSDPEKDAIVKACNGQKGKVLEYLSRQTAEDGKFPILKASLGSLAQTEFITTVNVTRLGYDFAPAGESLPNSDHQAVTDQYGKRVFVFTEGARNSWLGRLRVWKKVFQNTRFAGELDNIDPEAWITDMIAPHETGETASRNVSSDTRLGKYRDSLNEDKATCAGVAYLGELARNSDLDPDTAEREAKILLASNLCYLQFKDSLEHRPYYYHGLIQLHLALDTDLLRQEANQWVTDWTHSGDFLIALESHFWNDQVPLWEATDQAEATRLGEKIMRELGTPNEKITALTALATKQD